MPLEIRDGFSEMENDYKHKIQACAYVKNWLEANNLFQSLSLFY